MKPENLLFAKTHEWVAVTSEGGQKTTTVGISAFAVEALTDLVFIELPKVGRPVKAGESLYTIDPAPLRAGTVPLPAVVKPLVLSGSRGVIRANTAGELAAALQRVARLLR